MKKQQQQTIKQSKKADLEMDELGKIIIGVIALIIIVIIIGVVISGEFSNQGRSIADAFNIFK